MLLLNSYCFVNISSKSWNSFSIRRFDLRILLIILLSLFNAAKLEAKTHRFFVLRRWRLKFCTIACSFDSAKWEAGNDWTRLFFLIVTLEHLSLHLVHLIHFIIRVNVLNLIIQHIFIHCCFHLLNFTFIYFILRVLGCVWIYIIYIINYLEFVPIWLTFSWLCYKVFSKFRIKSFVYFLDFFSILFYSIFRKEPF